MFVTLTVRHLTVAAMHPFLARLLTLFCAQDDAALRPHWSSAEGGHLYSSSAEAFSRGQLAVLSPTRWVLAEAFESDGHFGVAYVAAAGAVPTGGAFENKGAPATGHSGGSMLSVLLFGPWKGTRLMLRSALYSSPAKIEHSPTDFQSSNMYLKTQP